MRHSLLGFLGSARGGGLGLLLLLLLLLRLLVLVLVLLFVLALLVFGFLLLGLVLLPQLGVGLEALHVGADGSVGQVRGARDPLGEPVWLEVERELDVGEAGR